MNGQGFSSITDLEQQIRDFINDARKGSSLRKDLAAWHLLCSSLDILGDTELAIEAYFKADPSPRSGDAYLAVYGVLQVLFVQQDGVEHICQALGAKASFKDDPALNRIREIRNNSVGHPTKRGGGKGTVHNFLSRPTLNKEGFQLMTIRQGKNSPDFETVDIPSLIKEQQGVLETKLREVVGMLKKEEAEHRSRYRKDKLQGVFSSDLGYYLTQIYGDTWKPSERTWGKSYRPGGGQINAFHQKLEERGLKGAYDSFDETIRSLEHAICRLRSFLQENEPFTPNSLDAEMFLSFTRITLEELKEMAGEVDSKYETEP